MYYLNVLSVQTVLSVTIYMRNGNETCHVLKSSYVEKTPV